MAEHDGSYKLLFSSPRMVEDLLRGFVHEEWVDDLDFSTLERVNGNFSTDDLRERRSDIIWRLRWRGDGGEKWDWFYVYLLLEFQSTPDPLMPVRLLSYVALLLASLVQADAAKLSDGLPAVLPLVLYNGKRPWNAATDLASLFREMPAGLERYQPQLTYLLIDENRLRPEALIVPGSRVAQLFRMETCSPGELPAIIKDLQALLPPDQEPELRRHFNTWIQRLVHRLRPGVTLEAYMEESAVLEETLMEWRNEAHESGLKEGRQIGREEGRQVGEIVATRRLLLNLLRQRFGSLPAPLRKRVQAIQSARRLQELAGRVLTAKSLADMGLG